MGVTLWVAPTVIVGIAAEPACGLPCKGGGSPVLPALPVPAVGSGREGGGRQLQDIPPLGKLDPH